MLANEQAMRLGPKTTADWTKGLVRFSEHAEAIFPESKISEECRTLTRLPTSHVSGFTFLDDLRPESIQLQPSLRAFSNALDILSDGLLKAWIGIMSSSLAVSSSALFCPSNRRLRKESIKTLTSTSIYMASIQSKPQKTEYIYDVWKKNLPEETETGVARNLRTFTFFAKYPLKRVQVVLKIVKSPKEVLLNLDLDVASMGWDGRELWMLPRAARALESEYSRLIIIVRTITKQPRRILSRI